MGCTFQHILENAGITTRNVSAGKCSPGGSAVATIKAHTLGDIAKAALQPHGEVHAEVLLRLMGEQTGHGGKDFTEQGFHALEEVRAEELGHLRSKLTRVFSFDLVHGAYC
jgi:hypothetical protein